MLLHVIVFKGNIFVPEKSGEVLRQPHACSNLEHVRIDPLQVAGGSRDLHFSVVQGDLIGGPPPVSVNAGHLTLDAYWMAIDFGQGYHTVTDAERRLLCAICHGSWCRRRGYYRPFGPRAESEHSVPSCRIFVSTSRTGRVQSSRTSDRGRCNARGPMSGDRNAGM